MPARAWIDQHSKSERNRDDNFFAMMDYERDLREGRTAGEKLLEDC